MADTRHETSDHQPHLLNNGNEAETLDKNTSNPKKRELSNEDREAILQALLSKSEDGILPRGAIQAISASFEVGRNTVGRIWARAKESVADGSNVMDVSHRKSQCGRKKKNYSSQMESFSQLPLSQRGTLQGALEASGIPKTTLFARMQEERIRAHTNAVKPTLTPENEGNR